MQKFLDNFVLNYNYVFEKCFKFWVIEERYIFLIENIIGCDTIK